MDTTYGIAIICLAIAMIWLASPADGVSLPIFKKAWIIGQLYVLATMVVFVVGAAFILG
jgi:hypothetical protein